MALNPVQKLQILAAAKQVAQQTKNSLDANVSFLSSQYPLAATQLQTLFAPVDTALTNALAQIQSAQTSTTVTDADRVAWSTQVETDAKA
jgi:hypothetical protein